MSSSFTSDKKPPLGSSFRSPSDSIARQPVKPNIQYVDRPECGETFADTINNISFDGQTMRIEFGVTRMEETAKGLTPKGRRYPACRVVLTTATAVDLINKVQQAAAAMEQAGILKINPAKSAGPEK